MTRDEMRSRVAQVLELPIPSNPEDRRHWRQLAADQIIDVVGVHPHFEDLVAFALDVLSIGGNSGRWLIADAIAALRIAVGQQGVEDGWAHPVSDEEREQLQAYIGGPL